MAAEMATIAGKGCTMNCRDARQYICDERDGALDEVRRAALAAHVAGCAECRHLRENLSQAVEIWRTELAAVPVPNAEFEWHKVRHELRQPLAARKRPLAAWLALPAAAAAAVAIGLYVSPHENGKAVSAPVAAAISPPASPASTPESTVVFVDDKSGWTFVWAPDSGTSGQHI
jgi:hypothetical protein